MIGRNWIYNKIYILCLLFLLPTFSIAGEKLIWLHPNGLIYYWNVANGQPTDGAGLTIPGVTDPNASIFARTLSLKGVGDLDGDGSDDLLWQDMSSGAIRYWTMANGARTGNHLITRSLNRVWQIKGTGDLNGDGTDDVVFQHIDGQVYYWPMNNGRPIAGQGTRIHTPVGSVWKLAGVGDVSGDGTDDLIWQHGNGTVIYWSIVNGEKQPGGLIQSNVARDMNLLGVGDVNDNGTDDIVWYHNDGKVSYWAMDKGKKVSAVSMEFASADFASFIPVNRVWTLGGVGNIFGTAQ